MRVSVKRRRKQVVKQDNLKDCHEGQPVTVYCTSKRKHARRAARAQCAVRGNRRNSVRQGAIRGESVEIFTSNIFPHIHIQFSENMGRLRYIHNKVENSRFLDTYSHAPPLGGPAQYSPFFKLNLRPRNPGIRCALVIENQKKRIFQKY